MMGERVGVGMSDGERVGVGMSDGGESWSGDG